MKYKPIETEKLFQFYIIFFLNLTIPNQHLNFMPNQNPEQIARDQIDKQFSASGWLIQCLKKVNLHAGIGVALMLLICKT